MPIPHLSKSNKNYQSWRKQKKKYYLTRNKKSFRKNKLANQTSFKPKEKKYKKFSISTLLLNKKTIKYLSVLVLAIGLFSLIVVAWLSRGLPDPNKLMDRQIAQSTTIFDRTGETVLYEIHGNEQRTLVALDELPEYIKWSTIAIEDKDFYEHGGISLWGIFRGVVWQAIRGKGIQGGSTLTQQFVKNAILTPERTISRKIKEWILAYKIESKYSKDEILQMYFNEIPYGSTAYGIEAASQKYFGKSAKDINLPEAAILSALPQAPSRYSPYGPNRNLLIDRQHYVLDQMYEQGYITEAKRDAAKQYELEFKKQSTNITAPHFVMYVKELLSEKYGEKMVEQEGLKIYTTLDLYKQEIAEEVINEYAEKNEKQYQATNAALISIDPKTGQILAMVGSRDYFNEDIDGQVNITTSLRQPGSSMKPLVYASAFIKGYTPTTILYDVVTNFSLDPSKPYEPHNYNLREYGPVTMRKALAGSLNIPAVKTIYLAGINNVLDLAQDLGYTSLSERDRFGLSLVLGGGEVKLIEHTNAFSAFAREGEIQPITAILKIEDKNGKVIEEFEERKSQKVLDSQIARSINDILSDNNARAYAFGERNWLTLGSRPVGAKTGTTNDYRDAWTIGYTPSIVTGTWVGNNDNSAMKKGAAGGTVAAPIWHDYMQQVLGDTPIEYFNKPKEIKTGKPVLDGVTEIGIKVNIDRASGLLATEYTPASFIEEKIYRQDHSILYYVNKNDPQGSPPKKPEEDPQFELWESRVLEWANSATSTVSEKPPTEYDNLHKPENKPTFNIITPTNNQAIVEPFIVSRLEASAPRGINRAEFYINNNLISTSNNYPFDLEKQINFLNNGFHNLKVRVCDNIDNCSEKSLEFNLILDNEQNISDIDISWQSPSSGLAINKVDFPLEIEIKINNPAQAAKINIFAVPKQGDPFIATVIQPIDSETAQGSWQKIPESGSYKLYAEAHGWSGQIKKTEEITITVANE
ncbi:MAG: penicillin-binding protein [Patescibacteria group bacterium]